MDSPIKAYSRYLIDKTHSNAFYDKKHAELEKVEDKYFERNTVINVEISLPKYSVSLYIMRRK